MHARVGAGSAPSNATHNVLEKIATESGLRSERESYKQAAGWRYEAESDSSDYESANEA